MCGKGICSALQGVENRRKEPDHAMGLWPASEGLVGSLVSCPLLPMTSNEWLRQLGSHFARRAMRPSD
jgi:hypothetical protein